jgi:O-succinylbenzoic acid--CoA ligase
LASARLTLDILDIKQGDNALLCLDAERIAGLMMIVRAMVGKLNLIVMAPSSDPLENIDPLLRIDLMAMVALQAQHVFDNYPKYQRTLDLCKAILIGGSSIDATLKEKIAQTKAPVYHTFGMTETASHIALRQLNGQDIKDDYQVLPGIEIGVDERSCLTITGKVTGGQLLTTNEIVELTGHGRFRWIGRNDHVINSGGVKIAPESLESEITAWLRAQKIDQRVMIFGLPDAKFGEKICMLIEGNSCPIEKTTLLKRLSEVLPRYHAPKEIYLINGFSYTSNGKLNRLATMKQIHPQKQ